MAAGFTKHDTTLGEIARLFLKLGTIGFGGPAAHIALMEEEVVGRRQWLTREAFMDYVGATNLIPGPNSTELAIEIGRDRAGWPGLIVAGVSFIAPAAVIVSVIAWAYVRFGQLPMSLAVLAGVKPVVIAVVAQALYRLTRTAVKNAWLAALAIGSIAAAAAGVHELVILLGAAVLSCLAAVATTHRTPPHAGIIAPLLGGHADGRGIAVALGGGAAGSVAVSLWPLFAIFLKIGSVLFGSGYVLLAFLRADFVQRLGWLTERQLLDAVAVGQVTPGPVFTTATFIGYVLAGVPGAVVATHRNLPAGVHLRRDQRSIHSAAASIAGCRCGARWRERRVAGAHGSRYVGAWPRGDRGRADGAARARGLCAAPDAPHQRGLAGRRRRADRRRPGGDSLGAAPAGGGSPRANASTSVRRSRAVPSTSTFEDAAAGPSPSRKNASDVRTCSANAKLSAGHTTTANLSLLAAQYYMIGRAVDLELRG